MSLEKLVKSDVPILGFGIYRNSTDTPWFYSGDFIRAIPEGPLKRFALPSPSTFVNIHKRLEFSGLIEVTSEKRINQGGRSRIMMRATGAAQEPLLCSLINQVTKDGLTLPGILLIPESTDFILNKTDFIERVIAQVSGTAINGATSGQ